MPQNHTKSSKLKKSSQKYLGVLDSTSLHDLISKWFQARSHNDVALELQQVCYSFRGRQKLRNLPSWRSGFDCLDH